MLRISATGPSASKDMDGKITARDLLRVFPELEAEEVAETSWQKLFGSSVCPLDRSTASGCGVVELRVELRLKGGV